MGAHWGPLARGPRCALSLRTDAGGTIAAHRSDGFESDNDADESALFGSRRAPNQAVQWTPSVEELCSTGARSCLGAAAGPVLARHRGQQPEGGDRDKRTSRSLSRRSGLRRIEDVHRAEYAVRREEGTWLGPTRR
jgi:phage tail tape-measure protein